MTETPARTPRVLLATFQLLPEGEARGDLIVSELAARGVEAAWAVWDDPDVAWHEAELVAARATWDYHRRLPDFLAWAHAVAATTTLLNGPRVFAWNAVKTYLGPLGEHVPTVPTLRLDDATLRAGLEQATARWGTVVVKPATGAGGVGVVIAEHAADPRLEDLTAGPWVAQPLVESVRTRGETSVFVLDGEPVLRVDKVPADGEIRVHEHLGGRYASVPIGDEARSLARAAVAAAPGLIGDGVEIAYARVDLLEHEGRLVVSELELIEPSLYVDIDAAMAARFADLVLARLR